MISCMSCVCLYVKKPISHLNNLFLHFLSFSKSQPRVRWSNLESRCNDLISKELYTSLPTSHQKKYEDFSNAKYGKVVFDNYTKMTQIRIMYKSLYFNFDFHLRSVIIWAYPIKFCCNLSINNPYFRITYVYCISYYKKMPKIINIDIF